ncbi:MAG: PD40 domain-containing protein [Bryobacteraceae bacterium]|nr:PD40 domain-containing protein [Bryobacteraceae bacterium]
MTRKAVETLLVLVEHPGQVLTKEEIMKAVWTDRVVDEANLAQNIAVIRKTLSAAKGTPPYIETFPGRGYRIEGPVSSEHNGFPSTGVSVSALPPIPLPLAEHEVVPGGVSPAPDRRAHLALAAALIVTLIGSSVYVLLKPAAWREAALRVVPATRLAGAEYQPAINRDATALAFLWAENGSDAPSVWVSVPGEVSPRPVSKTIAHHSSPAWSPNGDRLAFLRIGQAGTELMIATLADGSERRVAALSPPDYGFDNSMLTWSPDGGTLVISHSETPGKSPGLWLVSAESGMVSGLTRPGVADLGDVEPRFSPDGQQIAFLRIMNRSHQELFAIPSRGGRPVRLTNSRKRISGYDWLPNGELVVASNHGGEFRLWRLDPRLPGEMRATGIYSEFPIQLAIARTGSSLVYSALHQDRNIWRYDLKKGEWKRVIATTAQDASPVYSPSGDSICFRSDRSGEEQLWISGGQGENPVQLTKGNVRPSVGRWSPDGQSVVFNNSQTAEIFIAQQSGSEWHVRSAGIRGIHPVFSADGKFIYAGGSSVIRFPAEGGAPVTLLQFRGEALATSRDGQYLYLVREPNDTRLWRVVLRSGALEPVLEGIVPGCSSCWALSGTGLYYLGTDKHSFDTQAVYFRDLDGETSDREVVKYPEPLWPQGSGPFSVSPDGRFLLSVRVGPSNSDVMSVAGFQ